MWLWLSAVVALIVICLAILLFAPVRVRVRLEAVVGDIDIRVWVKPPVVPWYIRLPDLRRLSRRAPEPERDQRPDAGKSDSKSGGRPGDVIAAARRLWPDAKHGLSVIMRSVKFERFRVQGKLGTGDAYETAMLCGSINTVVGVFLSVASKRGVRFRQRPRVQFAPVFDRPHFSLSADVETLASVSAVLKAAAALKSSRLGRKARSEGGRSARGRSTLSSCESVEY